MKSIVWRFAFQLAAPITIVSLATIASPVRAQDCLRLAAGTGLTPLGATAHTNFYSVTNCGPTTLSNVTLRSNNATPDYLDDDIVVAGPLTLMPSAVATASREFFLPLHLCATNTSGGSARTSLVSQRLDDGNIKVTFIQSTNINDNTYGTNSAGWGTLTHTFNHLIGADRVNFEFRNGADAVVLDFDMDYISGSLTHPSGYGTQGATGGDGSMNVGNPAHVLFVSTSLTENLNKAPFSNNVMRYVSHSPAATDPNAPLWESRMIYTVVVSAAAFGPSGFGSVSILDQNNSPSKASFTAWTDCTDCVTNAVTATATASGGGTLTATARLTFCAAPPAPLLTIYREGSFVVFDWSDTNYCFQYARELRTPPSFTPWVTLPGGPPLQLNPGGLELYGRLIRPCP